MDAVEKKLIEAIFDKAVSKMDISGHQKEVLKNHALHRISKTVLYKKDGKKRKKVLDCDI